MPMLAPGDVLARAGALGEVSERQVEAMAALITGLGFRSPVVVDGSGRSVQGAVRVLAAQRLGLPAIPVRVLGAGESGLVRRRKAQRDHRAESLGVLGLTVWRPTVFSRGDVSWVACRAWRWSSKRADLAAFRAAKRAAVPAVVEAAAGDVARLVRRLAGGLSGWTVTAVPCGNSGTEECFGKRLGRATAAELGLPFAQIFEDRLVEGGSSHPRRFDRLGPLTWRERPAGPVLLVDDLATTGLHVAQALGALRGEGCAALAVVWISGEVK